MKFIRKCLTVSTLVFCTASNAAMPVFDGANLAQAVQQLEAWKKQFDQMTEQIEKLDRSYNNMHGSRGMGALVNDPRSRHYLPENYQKILQGGVGQWENIYKAIRQYEWQLSQGDQSVKGYEDSVRRAAIEKSVAEEAYKSSSKRFADIQALMDKIDQAPDAKDIADLQARIQAEQVMMQNEANRLQTLAMLSQAQRDLREKQVIENNLRAAQGKLPSGW